MKRKPLTDVEKRDMRVLRSEGKPLRAVAEQFGVTVQTVQRYTTPFVPDRFHEGNIVGKPLRMMEALFNLAWELHPDDEVRLWGCEKAHCHTLTTKGDDPEPCYQCKAPLALYGLARGLPGGRLR